MFSQLFCQLVRFVFDHLFKERKKRGRGNFKDLNILRKKIFLSETKKHFSLFFKGSHLLKKKKKRKIAETSLKYLRIWSIHGRYLTSLGTCTRSRYNIKIVPLKVSKTREGKRYKAVIKKGKFPYSFLYGNAILGFKNL